MKKKIMAILLLIGISSLCVYARDYNKPQTTEKVQNSTENYYSPKAMKQEIQDQIQTRKNELKKLQQSRSSMRYKEKRTKEINKEIQLLQMKLNSI